MKALILALSFLWSIGLSQAQQRAFTLASTTSTDQSGLFAHIIPLFRQQTGIEVRVVALGTGQALALAARGDADALLVHDRVAEDAFVAEGHGLDRRDVMYNDFVLVGPRSDPANVAGLKDINEAFRRIAAASAPFASRGDKSGTHAMELRLWMAAGVTIRPTGLPWYRELGSGMGATLNSAAGMGAYTLTDRGTWLAFKNRGDLGLLVQGDARLFNPYSSILVNPVKGAHIKAIEARAWHDWITSPAGQQAIGSFRIEGQPLFFPQASARRS